ncbi:PepSY-associated TM helix domain-containing protein [Deinococcus taeanensis]|uniref:PepSY-associated TM helix domain-containing protein n=1 Tax=Deinococcus taeanensis TaxID=2737050 RepID=UPI001CDBD322|nr:PepSY-associated TM helix domain-containing protein [Deinococcus taeanensis]UBV41879.1 PepSY-associated TM helix domain-containing protein [Deinococcus taeanensis]
MSRSARPEAPPADVEPARAFGRPAPRRSLKARTNVWLRWLHTYTSMISLLAVLFFALTGITLNHPDWVFGTTDVTRTVTGTLPGGWLKNGQPDWLTVAEELRAQQGLRGRASDPRADSQEADIAFLAPGYSADTVIDVQTGRYTTTILEQGAVAVMNDLHKGRDASPAWKWVIDLSGVFLGLISVTGLGILLYLRRTRVQALSVMGAGAVLTFLLAWQGSH